MHQQHQHIQDDGHPGDALDERGSYDRDVADRTPGRPADRAVQDGSDRQGSPDADGGSHRVDGADRPEFREPAPLPTTFGAPTVGGAVAASALAGDRRDPRADETARPGDGVAEDRIDGIDDGD